MNKIGANVRNPRKSTHTVCIHRKTIVSVEQKVNFCGLLRNMNIFTKHLHQVFMSIFLDMQILLMRHLATTSCRRLLQRIKCIRSTFLKNENTICGKCRKSDLVMNHLFSLVFKSTHQVFSSFITDVRPLHRSSCTCSCPSLRLPPISVPLNHSYVVSTSHKLDN